jgi:hypothetical protein
MNEKGMRSRKLIPAVMLPCNFCEKKRSIYHAASDISEAEDLEKECRESCEDFFFKKYGINRLVEPSIQETDYILEMIGRILEAKDQPSISRDDLERLEILGQRLSLVLNFEEARIAAAKNMLTAIDQATKGKIDGQ